MTPFPPRVQLATADDGAVVQLALGGELTVALDSNPSTGYKWSIAEELNHALVPQGEPRYVRPGATSEVIGTGGTEVFVFKAETQGAARLNLEYRRPFEPSAAPERTFSVTVEIR